jgi:hypothetical protein
MGGGFRSAAIAPGGAATVRSSPMAANAFAPGGFRSGNFRGGGFRHGFRHGRGFGIGAFGIGLGYGLYGPYGYYDDYYDYPDYAYDDAYYDNGGCYVVQRRVRTPYGWRIRPIQVCS